MPFRLVKGEFRLQYQGETRRVGSQPDGDSSWFKPDDPSLITDQPVGRSAELNAGGFAQLRYEAIDALELHYRGTEQNHELAVAARDFTLVEAGFTDVTYAPELYKTVQASVPDRTTGYVMVQRFGDGRLNVDPYGRPVAFVFPEASAVPDGDGQWFDPAWAARSINAGLARSGNAYPGFYTGLPVDLRRKIADLVAQARGAYRGIWRRRNGDVSTKGFTAKDTAGIEPVVVWPKLFRRLVSYFGDGHRGLAGFDAWLRDGNDDAVWIVSRGELGNLHDVLAVRGDKIRMQYAPGDLIVVPD